MLRIVTDGGADMPPEWLEQYDIHVMPLNIHFGDEAYIQGVNLDSNKFYELINRKRIAPKTSLPSPNQIMEFYRKINLMKAGIVFSDEITTVSETYAKEIQTFEYGCGLDGVLRHRSEHVTGIINGIDYNEWSPQVDSLIPAKYSPEQMAGKAECKKALQKKQNLPAREDVPLIGMISRMTDQKGFDLIVANAAELFKLDIQFAKRARRNRQAP